MKKPLYEHGALLVEREMKGVGMAGILHTHPRSKSAHCAQSLPTTVSAKFLISDASSLRYYLTLTIHAHLP